MSRFISLLKRVTQNQFNFININETEEDQDNLTVLTTNDVKLPSNMHFITPKIILMPFPTAQLRDRQQQYLNTFYPKRYMIWNLSEHTYDTSIFQGQVLDYIFVGYPNPPLEVIFAICTSIKAWLDTDSQNVAVLHCQDTKARSFMIASCFLAWIGQENQSPWDILVDICNTTRLHDPSLMFPSQMTYMFYVNQILNGEHPVTKKITIDRIILNGIPRMEQEGGSSVRPYLQIFKGQEMIYSSTNQLDDVVSYFETDMSVIFDCKTEVQGDVLIRCRHINRQRLRVTIFRAMFNTAFIDQFNHRISKSELDCAKDDPRFPDDFVLDLFFSDCQQTDSKEMFWKSLERQNPVIRPQQEPSSEEEQVDKELLQKYQEHLESSDEDDDDMDDYLKQLESKTSN